MFNRVEKHVFSSSFLLVKKKNRTFAFMKRAVLIVLLLVPAFWLQAAETEMRDTYTKILIHLLLNLNKFLHLLILEYIKHYNYVLL